MTASARVRKAISHRADEISLRGGVYTARRGFYYRSGRTCHSFRDEVVAALQAAGFSPTVVEVDEIDLPFRGGAPLRRQSHWLVRFTV